uniref:Uncharacterized protein n=1 Tax=Panagrolaimus superbus TaxID=310955 RepID=A0A914Y1Q7_9BILA
MLPFTFESAKVSDLCTFVAEKCFCPPGSTFKVSVKSLFEPGGPATAMYYTVSPSVDLEDGSEMFVVVGKHIFIVQTIFKKLSDLPSGDAASFQLPLASPSRPHYSQSQPSTPRFSQAASMDTSFESLFGGSSHLPSSSQCSIPSTHGPTATAVATQSDDANFMNQVNALLASQPSVPSSTSDATATVTIPAATLLLAVYFSQRQTVEAAYLGMKPDDPVLINNVDVFAFFDNPTRKSALVVLQNTAAHSAEIRDAAKVLAKKSLVEILVKAYPEYV